MKKTVFLAMMSWAVLIGFLCWLFMGLAHAQSGVKIGDLPMIPTATPNLTDTTVVVSPLCAGGNCQVSVNQLLLALTKLATNQTPSSSGQVVFASNGQLQLAPVTGFGVQNNTANNWSVMQTFSGGITATGGSLMNVTVNGYLPVGGAAADLGPALGPILGLWPYLYLAPSPSFTGIPTITNGTTSQLEFVRQIAGGNAFTFIGAAPSEIGISSSEALPIILRNNGYQDRLHIDTAGNVGIGTAAPAASLDVNGQFMILETPFTPASSSAACMKGQHAWDTGFLYICVATNSWRRIALGTF